MALSAEHSVIPGPPPSCCQRHIGRRFLCSAMNSDCWPPAFQVASAFQFPKMRLDCEVCCGYGGYTGFVIYVLYFSFPVRKTSKGNRRKRLNRPAATFLRGWGFPAAIRFGRANRNEQH